MFFESIPIITNDLLDKQIDQLIEEGKAINQFEARQIIEEEKDIDSLRTCNLKEAIRRTKEEFKDKETEQGLRFDLIFDRAVLEIGENPDELEFLWYHALSDRPFGKPKDDKEKLRTRERYKMKIEQLAGMLGEERSQELSRQYRERLLEIYEDFLVMEFGYES